METSRNRNPEKKKVVIIDDHPVVRQGISLVISQEDAFAVCAEAEDAGAGFEAIKKHKPDIAIVDISLKDISGIELIKWIKGLDFKVAVLVISMHDETVYAERALKAGAQGYLMKQEPPDKIIEAIHKVLCGEIYVSESVAKRMVRHLINGRAEKPSIIDALSDRELEVFQMIGRGFMPKEIAVKLCLSIKTIETYQANIKEKLLLGTSKELMRFAVGWMKQNP